MATRSINSQCAATCLTAARKLKKWWHICATAPIKFSFEAITKIFLKSAVIGRSFGRMIFLMVRQIQFASLLVKTIHLTQMKKTLLKLMQFFLFCSIKWWIIMRQKIIFLSMGGFPMQENIKIFMASTGENIPRMDAHGKKLAGGMVCWPPQPEIL